MPGTVVAVNVGGAVIPGLLSFYLLVINRLWARGLLATAGVAAVCHLLAPFPALELRFPYSCRLYRRRSSRCCCRAGQAAPLAYISGSLGKLIGANPFNLDKIQGLRAPVASIGGAGTFDGILLTGILAVCCWQDFSIRRTPRKIDPTFHEHMPGFDKTRRLCFRRQQR